MWARRTRLPGLAAVLALTALVAAGCGDDDGGGGSDEAAATKPAIKLPSSESGPTLLDPGVRYETASFRPKLTVTIPPGEWTTPFAETSTGIGFQHEATPDTQAILSFFHVSGVFDPKKGGRTADDAEAPPADFVDWLTKHPRLKATKPVPVELGSLRGRQVDVEVESASTEQPAECEDHACLVLYTDEGGLSQMALRNRMRYLVFENGTKPLIVEMFVNPGKQFDAEVPELEKLLKATEVAG